MVVPYEHRIQEFDCQLDMLERLDAGIGRKQTAMGITLAIAFITFIPLSLFSGPAAFLLTALWLIPAVIVISLYGTREEDRDRADSRVGAVLDGCMTQACTACGCEELMPADTPAAEQFRRT